jgi:hypothetical protein
MSQNDPLREFTPEELRAIYARHKKQFTVERLIEYIEDDQPKVPADVVLAEIEELVRQAGQGGTASAP